MIEFVFSGFILTLATMSVVDIYMSSHLLERFRERVGVLKKSPYWIVEMLGKGLNCDYCMAHWVALGWMLIVTLSPECCIGRYGWLDTALLIVIAARFSTFVRDFMAIPYAMTRYLELRYETRTFTKQERKGKDIESTLLPEEKNSNREENEQEATLE